MSFFPLSMTPLGFGPANSSSSKMEDSARSPRVGATCCFGFFVRYSSLKGFVGTETGDSRFHHRRVRLWIHGSRKLRGVWEEAVRALADDQLDSVH